MNLSHRSTQLTLLLLAWLCLRPSALGDSALVHASTEKSVALAAAKEAEPAEVLAVTLPDDGPRLEGQSQGMDALALQEGINAYGKGEWAQARRLFGKVVAQQPESPLTPTAMTFLAETALRENDSNGNRLEAIDRYKTLVRDYPQSTNAKRAEWRMADVYLSQGWQQEAQSMYERALAHNPQSLDGERALLGIGYIALITKKWSDAEHTFEDLRKRSSHDQILLHATIGLATAMYRQHRIQDALGLYDLSYRRWPKAIRMNPTALGRYAAIQLDLHHDVIGRGLLLQYYNLHPAHPDTPAVLLRLADSLQIARKPAGAELFYAFVAARYPGTTAASLATVRAASLRAEQMKVAGNISLALTVSSLIRNASAPAESFADALKQLRTFAGQYSGSAVGDEALFHLATHLEQSEEVTQALLVYKDVAERSNPTPDDPWSAKAAERLAGILRPWMEAAAKSHDDLTLTTLFHRHGPAAERHYLSSPLLLEIAEAHERLGFTTEAGRLYQLIAKGSKRPPLIEQALLGLGKVYLAQHDAAAARKVMERYRLEFPTGRFERETLHL
ncbi:MAG: tetratricopeptide repeat protein, partial [Nitrospira sp.]